jgi:CheY-like chemotaxis protein
VSPHSDSARVLVVDDCPDSTQILTELVRLWGFEARTAGDAATALRLAAEWRPDVILLDIRLPDMSGYEAARRLRRMPDGDRTLVVALSGYGAPECQFWAARAGIDHYCVKPVDPEALRDLLAETARPRRTMATWY